MHRLVLAAAFVTAFGGCTATSGLHTESTQVQLTEGNYRVVAMSVTGSSTGFKVFGIGGSATFAEAMSELRKNAFLKADGGPRALINVTQDERLSFYLGPLISSTEVSLSADVIEFTKPND